MDPISVAASVVGLLTAAAKISSTMQELVSSVTHASSLSRRVQHEVRDVTAVVAQLQPFVLGSVLPEPSRESMIDVNQVLMILTGTVCTFSELEKEVDGLMSDEGMGVLDRARWAWKEPTVIQLCQRLQDHKSSLSLMLTILTCKSTAEAKNGVDKLCGLVGQLVESNTQMSNRLRILESTMRISRDDAAQDDSASVETSPSLRRLRSEEHLSSHRLGFEDALFETRVYRNTLSRISMESLTSSKPCTAHWSTLSGLSLADVSKVSVLSLPLSANELYNPQWYNKERRAVDMNVNGGLARLARVPMPPHRTVSSITLRGRIYSGGSKARGEMGGRREGLSSLMSSVLRTPSKMRISAPENPVHVTHIEFDPEDGKFKAHPPECIPREWDQLLNGSGGNNEDGVWTFVSQGLRRSSTGSLPSLPPYQAASSPASVPATPCFPSPEISFEKPGHSPTSPNH